MKEVCVTSLANKRTVDFELHSLTIESLLPIYPLRCRDRKWIKTFFFLTAKALWGRQVKRVDGEGGKECNIWYPYPLISGDLMLSPCILSLKQIKTTGAFVRVAYYLVCRKEQGIKLQFLLYPCVTEYGFTFELSFFLVFSIENLFQYSGCFFLVASLLALTWERTVFRILLSYLWYVSCK